MIDGDADSSGDYGYADFPAGFGFELGGEPIRGAIASQAGVLRLIAESDPFDAQLDDFSLSGTPSPLPAMALGEFVVAPLYSDLQGSGTARVDMNEVDGRVVFLWRGWRLLGGDSFITVAFEAQFGNDGAVELHYCDGFDAADTEPSLDYTIGVQVGSSAETAAEVQHELLEGKSFRIAPG